MDWKRHIAVIAALGCLACVLQAVLIHRATVPGLDSVRFVRSAQAIDREGLLPALRLQRDQPMFPVCVWAVHSAVTGLAGEFRWAWALSVQLAAAIPLVLLVVPVYFLSRRLWGTAAGLAAGFLVCVLPEVARLGADGLGDSTHLLLFALALWAVVEYFEGREERAEGAARGRVWLLAAGLAAGLAALVRAESLVLPAALGIGLVGLQLRRRFRQPWRRLAAATGCFVLGLGLVFGPYLVAMRTPTPRAAVDRILGRYCPDKYAARKPHRDEARAEAALVLVDGRAMSFAAKDPTTSIRRRGYAQAVVGFFHELADAFGYWIGLPVLLGLWWRFRFRVRAVDVFLAALVVLFSVAVVHFAATEGYLGARHLLVLVVVGIGAAGQGLRMVWGWLRRAAVDRVEPAEAVAPASRRWPSALATGGTPVPLEFVPRGLGWAGPGLLLVAVTAYVVLVVGPLHTSRVGHRQAAEWLAGGEAVPGMIVDTVGWTGLYSGRKTCAYEDARALLGDPRLAYIVVEQGEMELPSRRGRTLRTLVGAAGRRVEAFPQSRQLRPGWQSVVVYRWDAESFRRWAAGSTAGVEPPEDRYVRAHSRVRPDRGRGI